MKIKKITIKDFRRFTDLTIERISPSVKLVVLLGRNGSGKSSLFDALSEAAVYAKHKTYDWSNAYHSKNGTNIDNAIQGWPNLHCEFHDSSVIYPIDEYRPKDFYFRTAYRFDSTAQSQSLQMLPSVLEDSHDPRKMINLDTRVADNYQRLVSNSLGALFEPGEANNVSRVELRDAYIRKIRVSMIKVFGDLVLEGPGRPLDDGTFLFTKGMSHGFKYMNLSGGEKAAFDLLLDIVLKAEAFNDTVYCLDEPELHMHSSLQGMLLDEILKVLPDKCQLWIATHSVGMIRKAKELYESDPNKVAFLDFSDRDFDQPQVLCPIEPSRELWRKAFEVSLGDLVSLIAPQKIFLCEGQKRVQGAKRNPDFDSRCYNKIFAKEFPDVQFVSVGGCNDVDKNAILAGSILQECVPGVEITTVYDCDDRSPEEIADIKLRGGRVLSLRDLENYLWDDAVIQKLCQRVQHQECESQLLQEKKNLLSSASVPNDVKSVAGQLYNKTKSLLGLANCGNTHETFARDTLAPLITPELDIYKKLRHDIFGVE